MKLNLLTYDSIVVHNADYQHHCVAVDFIKTLAKLVNEFSNATGVSKECIQWHHVTDSDWISQCLIIYARVEPNWKPTNNTNVWDDSYDPNWFPNSVKNLWSWMTGRGKFVNIELQPPTNPHNLFRTIVKK